MKDFLFYLALIALFIRLGEKAFDAAQKWLLSIFPSIPEALKQAWKEFIFAWYEPKRIFDSVVWFFTEMIKSKGKVDVRFTVKQKEIICSKQDGKQLFRVVIPDESYSVEVDELEENTSNFLGGKIKFEENSKVLNQSKSIAALFAYGMDFWTFYGERISEFKATIFCEEDYNQLSYYGLIKYLSPFGEITQNCSRKYDKQGNWKGF